MPMESLDRGIDRWGKNMRETCARVLAAALLIGTIAAVAGLSALSGQPGETGGPIAAPPSALQRTVRLTALSEHRRAPAAEHVTEPLVRSRAQSDVVTRSFVVVRRPVTPRTRPSPRRRLAASHRHAAVAVPVPVAPPAAPAPAATAPVPTEVPADEGDNDDRGGGGHGHRRSHQPQDD
jgi:hypothetical protein